MALLIAHTFSRTTGGTRWKPYVVRVWYNIHINACPVPPVSLGIFSNGRLKYLNLFTRTNGRNFWLLLVADWILYQQLRASYYSLPRHYITTTWHQASPFDNTRSAYPNEGLINRCHTFFHTISHEQAESCWGSGSIHHYQKASSLGWSACPKFP